MEFTYADIEPMALGAAVLGGGGGGSPLVTRYLLENLLEDGTSVEICGVEALDDDADVAPFALVGSPHVLAEKLLSSTSFSPLFSAEGARRRTPVAVMPFELAGLNALYPLAAAAYLGVPCIDADFTGQGVAKLDMTVLELDGVEPQTWVLSDAAGRIVTVNTGGLSVQALLGPVVGAMGWAAAFSCESLSGSFLKQHALTGTLTRCLSVGKTLRECRDLSDDDFAAKVREFGGQVLANGVILQRMSRTDSLGARSSLTIRNRTAETPATIVEFRDEFHLVARAGVVLASVPDIICVIDRDTFEPLSVDDAVVGCDVTVIALSSHPRWHSQDGIALAGPRRLGYGVDYVDHTLEAVGR